MQKGKKSLALLLIMLIIFSIIVPVYANEEASIESVQEKIESMAQTENLTMGISIYKNGNQGNEGLEKLYSSEIKEKIISSINMDANYVDLSKDDIAINLENGKNILTDFEDDLFFEFPEETFCVKNLSFSLEDGRLILIRINYTETKTKRIAMRQELNKKINSIVEAAGEETSDKAKAKIVCESIWKNYYNDDSESSIHCNDAYGCLIEGYASTYGASSAFQACMKRLGFEGGYYFDKINSTIYNKTKIDGKWLYTNIALNQEAGKNRYLLVSKTEQVSNYPASELSAKTYAPISLFSYNEYLDEKGENGWYFNSRIISGETNFTLPERVYYNYKKGYSSFIVKVEHEYVESGILVKSVSAYIRNNKIVISSVVYKNDSLTERNKILKEYYAARENIVNRANLLNADRSKVILVSNYINKIAQYKEYSSSTYLENSHNAYGCLVEKKCVCEGYSTAFHDIMKQLNIKDVYVQSYSHMWNKVYVDGSIKVVDVTNNKTNSFLLADDHREGLDITESFSRYKYALNPSLSMKSSGTARLIKQIENKNEKINSRSFGLSFDDGAKRFDLYWYLNSLKNIYPVEMRDVESVVFNEEGTDIVSVNVTYRTRENEEEFDQVVEEILNKVKHMDSEEEIVETVAMHVLSMGCTRTTSDDLFNYAVNKEGSYLARTRFCCYILEKLGIRYSIVLDKNNYPYIKTVNDGEVRYTCCCINEYYINVENIDAYSLYNYCPVFEFFSEKKENNFLDERGPIISDIAGAEIEGVEDKDYTGEYILQDITLSLGGEILKEGANYAVEYKNNKDAGTAKIHITGLENIVGEVDCTFKINPKDINDTDISGVYESYYFSGEEISPEVNVKDGDVSLTNKKDYTVEYEDNEKAGTAKIIISGKNNYCGEKTIEFTIRNSVAELSVTGMSSSCKYTGEEITPTPTIKNDKNILRKDVDYVLTYKNNIDAGTGTVCISGINDYSGEIEKEFEITKRPITNATVLGFYSECEYIGSPIQMNIRIVEDGKLLIKDKDYVVVYRENIKVGTATMVIKGIGNYSGVMYKKFKITTAPIDKFKISEVNAAYCYTGQRIKPNIVVGNKNIILKEGMDYDVYYFNNKHIGYAMILVVGKNGYYGVIGKDFKIIRPEAKEIVEYDEQ